MCHIRKPPAAPNSHRVFCAVLLLFFCGGFFPCGQSRAAGEEAPLTIYYPLPATLTKDDYVLIEGWVEDEEIDRVSIVVNREDTYEAIVRDRYFAEEVDLSEGANTLQIAGQIRTVFYDAGGDSLPGQFQPVYGHYSLPDGCIECHDTNGDGRLVTDEETRSSCRWCHSDLIRNDKGDDYTSVHRPVKDGRCLDCHDPHLSRTRGLIAEDMPSCKDCHAALYERLESDRYVHGPLNLGDCSLCHRVHSSPEAALLSRPPATLCTECHSEIRAAEGTPPELMPHTMVPEGRCSRCHFPHSSDNPRLMRQASSRICYECHPEKSKSFHEKKGFSIYVCLKCHDLHRPTSPHLIVDNSRYLCLECHRFDKEAAFTHKFITEGGCFLCHTFHAAPLSADIATVCLQCHGDDTGLDDAHRNIPLRTSRCTLCHLPHQSEKAALLQSYEHTPFRERRCGDCHADGGADLEGPVRPLCTRCHDDKTTEAAGTAQVHPPFRKDDCGTCHLSHSGPEEFQLREAELTLCIACHRKLKKATVITPRSSHQAVLDGECHRCHDAHYSDNPKLLREPLDRLCANCHPAIGRDEGGRPWPVPHQPVAAGKCRLCHRSHTSRTASLLRAPSPRVCTPCHGDFFSGLRARTVRSVHQPVKEGACGDCHLVHGSDYPSLRTGPDIDALCRSCHPKLKNMHHRFTRGEIEAKVGKEHMTGEDCVLCHRPHYAGEAKLLKRRNDPVCRQCHTI